MVRKIGAHRRGRKRTGVTRHRRVTHHRTRRRRIGAAGDMGGMLSKAGGLVVGAVAARELNTILVKMFPTLTPLVSGIGQMAVGFMLPKFVKGAFFANVGDGMIANGGMVAVVSTGIIAGTSDTMTYKLSGTSRLKAVGGTSMLKAVGGTTNRIQNTHPAVGRARNFRIRG